MYLGIDQSLRSSGVVVVTENQEVEYVGTVTPSNPPYIKKGGK